MMRNWRAGTITLGLALIAFGVGMLISGASEMYTLVELVLWWPVLVMLLGCEVLASLFFSKEKPLKVRYDGGSIFLIAVILFFCIGLSVFSYAVGLLPDGMESFKSMVFNEKAVVEKEYVFHSNRLFIDNNTDGNITVSPSQDGKTYVEAVITIDNMTIQKVDKLVDTIISADSNTGVVNTHQPEYPESIHHTRVDFNIMAAENMEIEVENRRGNVNISNVYCNMVIDNEYGEVSADSVEGDIFIENSHGNTKLFAVSGDVTIDNRYSSVYIAEPGGVLDIRSDNGSVELLAGRELIEDVSIHTTNSNAKVVFVESQTGILKAVAYSGDIISNINVDIADNGGAKNLHTVIDEGSAVFDISADTGSIEVYSGKTE